MPQLTRPAPTGITVNRRGSWSNKAVLLTIAAQMDYADLEVKGGGSVLEAYVEAIAANTANDRRMALDAALRACCGLDTEAMIVLARWLTDQHQAAVNLGEWAIARR